MKIFVLLKDYSIPGLEVLAGTKSTTTNNIRFSFCNGRQCKIFGIIEIENYPEFFKLEKE